MKLPELRVSTIFHPSLVISMHYCNRRFSYAICTTAVLNHSDSRYVLVNLLFQLYPISNHTSGSNRGSKESLLKPKDPICSVKK